MGRSPQVEERQLPMVHRGRARMRSPMRKASGPGVSRGGGGRGVELDGEHGPGGFDDKVDLRRAFLGAEVAESAALAAEGDLGAELSRSEASRNRARRSPSLRIERTVSPAALAAGPASKRYRLGVRVMREGAFVGPAGPGAAK